MPFCKEDWCSAANGMQNPTKFFKTASKGKKCYISQGWWQYCIKLQSYSL